MGHKRLKQAVNDYVAVNGYESVGISTSDVTGAASSIFDIFRSGEQAKGAAAALSAQQQALLAQQTQPSFLSNPMNLLLLAGGGIALVLLLKKKKS